MSTWWMRQATSWGLEVRCPAIPTISMRLTQPDGPRIAFLVNSYMTEISSMVVAMDAGNDLVISGEDGADRRCWRLHTTIPGRFNDNAAGDAPTSATVTATTAKLAVQ